MRTKKGGVLYTRWRVGRGGTENWGLDHALTRWRVVRRSGLHPVGR